MSKINEYDHKIGEYLEKIDKFPEPAIERSFLAKELEKLTTELKYLKNQYKKQDKDKFFTLKLFQIYQKLYSILKRAKFHHRYFKELFEWFEKCYKLGYGNIEYCKYYIQFDIWVETFCENLNAYIDTDIDFNDDYIPLLNIDEYYDYAKFLIEDFKKYIYRWEKLQELFNLQAKLPKDMNMIVSQVIRRDLSVKNFSGIIKLLNDFIKLTDAEQNKKSTHYKNEIIKITTRISENDKINNADLPLNHKKICDYIWKNKGQKASNRQLADEFGYVHTSIKPMLTAIYNYFDLEKIEGKNKQKLLYEKLNS